MALTKTTTSAAVGAGDTSVLLTALTGLAAGSMLLIDAEMMKVVSVPSAASLPVPVLRGQDGTKQVAHVSGANAIHSATPGLDFGGPVAGAPSIVGRPASRNRTVASYGAAGAIALPTPGTDAVAIINGTAALAMTLANPLKDNDGDVLIVGGNGKAAHTITYSAGFGGNTTSSDVLTLHASQAQAVMFVAMNEVWNLVGHVAGAATVAGAGLA